MGLDGLNRDGVGEGLAGQVTVRGRVVDGNGKPVSDALLEIWQADPTGRYAHAEDTRPGAMAPGFSGFARVPTGGDGSFAFSTIKPGRVPGPGASLQAPHLVVLVFMRGLLKHLYTRLYFPNEPANGEDAVLALVPAERRHTLVAQPQKDGSLEWNVMLQGEHETVFFDY